jgi:hypothetical protein
MLRQGDPLLTAKGLNALAVQNPLSSLAEVEGSMKRRDVLKAFETLLNKRDYAAAKRFWWTTTKKKGAKGEHASCLRFRACERPS